jgi:hypothetical protein
MVSGLTLEIASISSIIDERLSFSFLSYSVMRQAHPPRYLRVTRSLSDHLWMGTQPATGFSHIFLTKSEEPALCNHPSSILKERFTRQPGYSGG